MLATGCQQHKRGWGQEDLRSDIWGNRAGGGKLYSEVQGIISNCHMGTPPWTDTHDKHTRSNVWGRAEPGGLYSEV